MTLEEIIRQIRPLDKRAMTGAQMRWDSIAKPLGSLGLLEGAVIRIAGITGSPEVDLSRRCVVIFCGDNGVVAQGVTQTGQDVTAIVAENFTKGETSVCAMARAAKADIVPVDMGIARELHIPGLLNRRVRAGTADFTEGPAMSRKEAMQALESGAELAFELKQKGYQIAATGEMGIGNTTTSSAIVSVLLDVEPETVTGRGAGLDSAGLRRKIDAIRRGIALNQPDAEDAVDVLAKVGGLDIAGMAGFFLGCAATGLPVVADGFISAAAALVAVRICPTAAERILASHVSAEPAGRMVLNALGLSPMITAGMCLGEGTGAVALFPLLDMGLAVYREMSTFSDVQIEAYTHFDD